MIRSLCMFVYHAAGQEYIYIYIMRNGCAVVLVLVQGHMLSRPNRRLRRRERKRQPSDAQICGSRKKRFVERRNMLGEEEVGGV